MLLACADGAGSALRSEIGSRLACDSVIESAESWLADGTPPAKLQDSDLEAWVLEAIHRIIDEAERQQLRPRDLACTFLFAMISEHGAAFAQLGDGAIVVGVGEEYVPIFWPQGGEYANQTFFLTDTEALTRVQYDRWNGPIDEVALFTDGIQSLVLHYASQSASTPIFARLFATLSQRPPGEPDEGSFSLARFLDSPAVNQRTDDDKTLLLASRRSAIPRPWSSELSNPPEKPIRPAAVEVVTLPLSEPGDEPTQAG